MIYKRPKLYKGWKVDKSSHVYWETDDSFIWQYFDSATSVFIKEESKLQRKEMESFRHNQHANKHQV